MNPTDTASSAGTLLFIGAEATLGAEILARLQPEGYTIVQLPAGDLAALQKAVDAHDDIAALVINLPVQRAEVHFDAITDADFEAALQEQLLDVVAAGQAVLPRMRRGARIVHVGARGHLGGWGGAHQMAAGAALAAMTRSMALELEPEGIRVNLVAGEFIGGRQDTPANRAAIARAVAYLAAPDSGVTGQILLIDGHSALRMGEARPPRSFSAPAAA